MFESKKRSMAECGNCGAPLPVADADGVQTCTFCRTAHESPKAAAPQAPPQIHINVGSNVPRAAKKGAAGCGLLTTLIVLMVVAAIAIPVYIGVKAAVDTAGGLDGLGFGGEYDFGTGFTVLPGEPSSPSVVAMHRVYENGTNIARLTRFDSGRSEPAWTTGSLGDSADAAVLADQARAYVAKTDLVAVNLADGKEAWRVKLSDEYRIDADCRDCFTLAGGLVLVRTADGTLQGLDATTGTARWTRTFTNTRARLIRVGPHVVVHDSDKGDDKLATIDLATGQDSVAIPVRCQVYGRSYVSELDSMTMLQASPAGDSLLAIFGGSATCAQGWDVTTGALQWNVLTEVTSFDRSNFQVLDSPHGLVMVSRGVVGLIDPARTSFRKLVDKSDEQLTGLGVHGNLLVVEQNITRGTQKYGLAAIDLGSGEQRWAHTTGKAQPVGPSFGSPHYNTSGDGTFIANVAGGRVLMVTFIEGSSKTHTMNLQALDASTGTPSPPKTMESGSNSLIPSFGPDIWLGDKVVARVGDDTIQVLDPGNGTVVTKIG